MGETVFSGEFKPKSHLEKSMPCKNRFLLGLLFKRKLLQDHFWLNATSLPSAKIFALCVLFLMNRPNTFFFIVSLPGNFGLPSSSGGASSGFALLTLQLSPTSGFPLHLKILKRNAGTPASLQSSG